MTSLIVSDEQAKIILASDQTLAIEDSVGNIIAHISPPIRHEDIRDVERAITSPERYMEWRIDPAGF